ncbi:unnamed protein product [Closterium sp. NIES-65]|nr:unnamed protein product [Closterium sp. NIES-65]
MASLTSTWYSEPSPRLLVARPSHESAPSPSSSSPLSLNSPSTLCPPPLFSPHLLHLVADCVLLKLLLLHTFPPPQYPPLNCSTTSSFTTLPPLFSPFSSPAADNLAAIPPPFISPLSGGAADYLATIPPPLVSPLSDAASDYSATIPPLVSLLSRTAADFSATIPPPLVSPLSGSAADYSVNIPPPLDSPPSGSAADCFALIPPPLIPLPSSALQLSPLPYDGLSRPPLSPSTGTLVSGFNLWFVTQQSGSDAIHKPASAPTSTSSYPYADGLRAAIAETERIAATAQATTAARGLARVLAESLESTPKRLTEHLAAPSPRSASTPSASAPSHSDLLANWHAANARASHVILDCLPLTLLPQCSHIRYAKELLSYLTERFQSQTPINVIALLRELTSLRLADFTTMADYIARVQTLSSQLAAQKFELSNHVCGALLLTGLTPKYSIHLTLYGKHPANQWSFSRVSAFLLQAELNLRSCPPTAAAITPSFAPPSLSTSTAAAASSRPHNTFPPCTYIIRQGPRKGAGHTMTMICTTTSSLPCPASPSGAVTGLYVPSCRHNFLSLSALQRLCVRAIFPECDSYCDLYHRN